MTDIKIRHRLWRCEYGFCCDYEPFVYGGGQIEHFVSYSANFLFVWQKYYKNLEYTRL